MKTNGDKYQKEIEIEDLWIGTQSCKFLFFIETFVTIFMSYGLWDVADHNLLLVWVTLTITISVLKLFILNYYQLNKTALIKNIRQFKILLLSCAGLTSLCLLIGEFWLYDHAKPGILILLSFVINLSALIGLCSWFSYLPALLLVTFPAALAAAILIIMQGDKLYVAISILGFAIPAIGVLFRPNMLEMINYGLRLNFENAELRKESEEKSLLLEKALLEAEQANAAKTRFLAAASHDLRQPIHALGLFFSELSDRVYNPDTAAVIGQVEDSIAATNSMLNALLDLSKLDAGIVKPVIETFALAGLFSRLNVEFQPIALESHNELRIRPTKATVDTDPGMLEQMLRNLIGNALRYTENGRILVSARRRGKNIDIQVFDTGSGIPEGQLTEIFVEFHQLQNPARDRRQGLGLGLAIVKRLAKLLDHPIKMVSRLGSGSCFSISLPLAHKLADSTGDVLNEISILLHVPLLGRQILVLDDDIAVLDGMRGLLTRWGCNVISVSSPEEVAIKLAESTQKLELLIIDYRLPTDISGIEVARNLQSSLGYPFAVLVITGDTAPERLREADASGYPLLHKPVQPAQLRSTLQFLLTR